MSEYQPDQDEKTVGKDGMEIEISLRPGITESPPVIKKKSPLNNDYKDPRIQSCVKIYSQSKLR